MRTEATDPWWITAGIDLIGFEDEDDDDSSDEDAEENDDDGSEDDDDGTDGDDDGDGDGDDEESEDDDKKPKEDLAGLKSALRKERLARKKAERDLKKLQPPKKKAAAKPPKGKEEADEEESESTPKEDDRVKALAQKLKDNAVDTAILQFGDQFQSSKELLALIDRAEIDVDQDEDEPSEIDVDLETVEAAVKALAKSSPHLLKKRASRTPSGSKFGGKKKSGKASEQELRKKYPALRH